MNQICGLWKNKSEKGQTYYKGKFLGLNVLIFPNNNKSNDNQPDVFLCLDVNKTQQANDNQTTTEQGQDDLPF